MSNKTSIQLPSAWDFLKEAWEIMREHSQLLMGLVALVYVPINALLYFALLNQESVDSWSGFATQMRFSGLLEFVLGSIPTIGAIYLVGLSKGQKLEPVSTFNELAKQVGNKYGATLKIMIRSGFLLMLLSFLLVIPGIIYGIYWVFAIPIAILTDQQGGDILKTSKELVTDRWWSVLGYSFAFGLAGIVAALVAGIPSMLVPESIAWFSIFSDTLIDFITLLPIMAGALLYLKFAEIGPTVKSQK